MDPISEADLELLLLIRHFEHALLEMFGAGEVSGTTHTCLGQEYIPVIMAPLARGDFVLSNHRGHGHYLAHCGSPSDLLAEILGRQGAPGNGVGGSQHLNGTSFLSTGVQGESLPVAVGVALHAKAHQPGQLALAYIGDGTFGEGAVYEALNMAGLWSLPLLIVVENNGIAQSTPTSSQLAGTVAGRAAAFGVAYHRVDGMDVTAVRAELAPLVADVRQHCQPLLVEFATVRLGPHSKGDDTRSPSELAALAERDWHRLYARQLGERFAAAEARQRQRVAQVVDAVRRRPLAAWEPG